MTCHRCGAPAYAQDRCRTCYDFRRRTGEERSEELILRAAFRSEERPGLMDAMRALYREKLAEVL